MAGHSKWANIKRHKAKQDAKRSQVYTKIIREITVAARLGGGEAHANPRLRAALEKAQEANMTKDVVDRAIKRGVGGLEGEQVEEIRYEGYGPNGVAYLIDCITNNRNRTVAEVRHLLTKAGGNLGTSGSVAYLFKHQGQITFAPPVDDERLMAIMLEAGADDIVTHDDGSVDVLTSPDDFLTIKKILTDAHFQPVHADASMVPMTLLAITDKDMAEKILKLTDALDDLEDVQAVYNNADISEDLII
jgi:YebC/PmpR family DNA-binding regulatory protein